MKVVVINYGMGNLGSVRRAFEECGADAEVAEDPATLGHADRIVLPGVGAFRDGMAHLQAAGWPARIRAALENPEVRLLGICLGMQLLAESGSEGGKTEGLALIPGHVQRLQPDDPVLRVPHSGWNEVRPAAESRLLEGIAPGTDFYFVHSYHFRAAEPLHILATTPYGGSFVSVIGTGNVFGTQFHPEKSSRPGFQLIRNFLA